MNNNHLSAKDYIKSVIHNETFAILSSEGKSQPHASLIAVTVYDELKSLLFATYKDTRKYENICHNPKVAVLFDNRSCEIKSSKEIVVITAFGLAKEVAPENLSDTTELHLKKHPDLKEFLASTNCALIEVQIEAYQIVKSIESVEWCKTSEF